jgi:hypothetical protein
MLVAAATIGTVFSTFMMPLTFWLAEVSGQAGISSME